MAFVGNNQPTANADRPPSAFGGKLEEKSSPLRWLVLSEYQFWLGETKIGDKGGSAPAGYSEALASERERGLGGLRSACLGGIYQL